MKIEQLDRCRLPALIEFFREVGASITSENIDQFCLPRAAESGPRVGTLVLAEGDRILGSIGYLDIPLRASGAAAESGDMVREEISRWPINQFLLPEWRGRGLGQRLMDAAGEGAPCMLVIGGTKASTPSRSNSGWRLIGQLECWRFRAPVLSVISAGKLKDRTNLAGRRLPPATVCLRVGWHTVVAQRSAPISGWLPWVAPDPPPRRVEIGAPRDADYLRFAFCGALSEYHALHTVSVDGAAAGFFVLAARAERPPFLSIEIVDLDAAPGREADVIEAARATGFTRGDIVRLRVCGDRFTQALRTLRGHVRRGPDHAFRVLTRPGSLVTGEMAAAISSWRLTYGDHDQYRVRTTSRKWTAS